MDWFKQSYLNRPHQFAARARRMLDTPEKGAVALHAKGTSGSWRSRLSAYRKAASLADESLQLAAEVQAHLQALLARREQAFQAAQTFSAAVDSSSSALRRIDERAKAEMSLYPSRYGTEIAKRSHDGAAQLEVLVGIRPRYEKFLPSREETAHAGDPDQAFGVLNLALARSEVLRQHCLDALNWLDITRMHYDKAPEMVERGEFASQQADSGLSERKRRTGYWLKSATAISAEGRSRAKLARGVLTNVARGEKLPDRPEAYLRAEESVALSGKALQNADAEIALAKSVLDQRRNLAQQIDAQAQLAARVQDRYRVLQLYHGAAAWSEYSSIAARAGARRVTEHITGLDRVTKLASLEVQEFAKADELVRAELDAISSEISRGRDFVQLADRLEEARRQYSGAIQRAQSVINAESGDVASYGQYSPSDAESFHDAEQLLRRARNKGSERLFLEAVALANQAVSEADGTGDNCREAHRRHQEEEEAARRRAASSSSSWGSDDGGSSFGSSSGSDFGSSSGSDWGGGSDSDWGGGSDSDAGGGSDSDW
ncbi:MAG: hypothetical protein K1X83_12130 [Oligoflexia bacterium]|nr:hypothetical protein [Oligoflexia bacterium]